MLFVYCHKFLSEHRITEKYETNVLASDISDAILNNIPQYGERLAISANSMPSPTARTNINSEKRLSPLKNSLLVNLGIFQRVNKTPNVRKA